ncbi:hypothetical protein J2T57_001346 [Natronocella acetinitrilica]|uniref:Uncharacterized protein n=1 Tax=Natronocella acetinitrilica TaxID=414046 RepID=A0AAE3G271_9GAMM|nr:hypothetical protein [Natronocella acetinitrilica]MCP1674244.1 hypothetical protein [Natronocella acetinitrilica]
MIITKRMQRTALAVALLISAASAAVIVFYDPPPPPAVESAVAMTTNPYGHRTPLVEARALRSGAIPPLSQALANDSKGELSQYVRAYLYYANNMLLTQSPVTEAREIGFVIDTAPGRQWRIDWDDAYPLGIAYRGGAIFDAEKLQQMAYGILLEWTGQDEWQSAVIRFNGRIDNPGLDFNRALYHIHQELLSQIYVPGIQQSSGFRPLPSLFEADRMIERASREDTWSAISRQYRENNIALLGYLQGIRGARAQSFSQDAYVVVSYFLGPEAILFDRLRNHIGADVEGSQSEEQRREQRERRAQAEREQAQREREAAEMERRRADRERERRGPPAATEGHQRFLPESLRQ